VGDEISINRKALRDYHILETIEAGIELRGTEVKSIRQGFLNLQDAFARVEKGQIWLHQCDILPYSKASHEQHEARRPRRLLLHKREIQKLFGHVMVKGISLIAVKAYWKEQRVKILLGLGKGKASHDKRDDVKKREADREIQRSLAQHQRRH